MKESTNVATRPTMIEVVYCEDCVYSHPTGYKGLIECEKSCDCRRTFRVDWYCPLGTPRKNECK